MKIFKVIEEFTSNYYSNTGIIGGIIVFIFLLLLLIFDAITSFKLSPIWILSIIFIFIEILTMSLLYVFLWPIADTALVFYHFSSQQLASYPYYPLLRIIVIVKDIFTLLYTIITTYHSFGGRLNFKSNKNLIQRPYLAKMEPTMKTGIILGRLSKSFNQDYQKFIEAKNDKIGSDGLLDQESFMIIVDNMKKQFLLVSEYNLEITELLNLLQKLTPKYQTSIKFKDFIEGYKLGKESESYNLFENTESVLD